MVSPPSYGEEKQCSVSFVGKTFQKQDPSGGKIIIQKPLDRSKANRTNIYSTQSSRRKFFPCGWKTSSVLEDTRYQILLVNRGTSRRQLAGLKACLDILRARNTKIIWCGRSVGGQLSSGSSPQTPVLPTTGETTQQQLNRSNDSFAFGEGAKPWTINPRL